MILTGDAIIKAVKKGDIFLSPFDEKQVNPNSYNYRLGNILKIFTGFDGEKAHFQAIISPESGYLLQPGIMYLGHTKEIIGSKKYAMSLIGRSSVGRLGLFLQVSADLGHTTSQHQWTLELVAAKPIILYPNMKIGQVTFWNNCGVLKPDTFTYANFNYPYEAIAK